MKKIIHYLKNKDFQKRFWFTAGLLIVYEFGSMITLPGINQSVLHSQTQNSSFIQLLNMVGGGSIDRMSLFALGVTPFITASIVIQLMSSDVIPYLTRLKDQGIKGQNKLDRITRVFTIFLAFLQSYGMIVMIAQTGPVFTGNQIIASMLSDPTLTGVLKLCLVMTAGSMIAIWFGDLLTVHGLGNGASMIICAGILMRMPAQITQIWGTLVVKNNYAPFIWYALSVLALVIAIVILQLSELHIPIWDPSTRIQKVNSKDMNFLPLKVNTPGVMPIIFASSIMIVPLEILQLVHNSKWIEKLSGFLSFGTWYSVLIYGILVVLFSFFYAKIQIDPKKAAENLTKQNSFIPGYQPGEETEQYISHTLNHVMVFGAIGLTVVAVIPYILPMITPLTTGTAIGGTSILIIVGVLIELEVQIKGLLHKDRYDKFRIS